MKLSESINRYIEAIDSAPEGDYIDFMRTHPFHCWLTYIKELEKENAKLKDELREAKEEINDNIVEWKKENTRLKEENRAGTNALKLSGQALSKALDDVERLLAENKRLVDTIKGEKI